MRGSGGNLTRLNEGAGLSLFFQPGERPAATDIEHILARSPQVAQISHRGRDDEGWLELVAAGLTFDLHCLAPGDTAPVPAVGHAYGLPTDIARFGFEAIVLAPAAHISAGAALLAVVRVLLGVAAGLARELPITALCWNPAQSWMEPKYFGRMVTNWLAGGAFPALGLTALQHREDGVLESTGLAYFIGQELRVPRRGDEPSSDTIQRAKRVIDHLIVNGPLQERLHLPGSGEEQLMAEPSADGNHVTVSRIG